MSYENRIDASFVASSLVAPDPKVVRRPKGPGSKTKRRSMAPDAQTVGRLHKTLLFPRRLYEPRGFHRTAVPVGNNRRARSLEGRA